VVGNPVFARTSTLLASAPQVPLPTSGERAFLLGGVVPSPLPATGEEAKAIARFYGSVPLLGESATEAALRQQIEQAQVIHLATHGFLHPTRPMSSGVLLTLPEKEPGPQETANDGVLQAWEIYSELKLKAELVVLSACETGRGQNVAGEGIVGLTRALQSAGARSIVASRWAVSDESTRRLMVGLHRKLWEGKGKDEALREAMREVREEAERGHPYYWAPFFLLGDPDTVYLGGQYSAK
jgi:CHAT domain-containing protein